MSIFSSFYETAKDNLQMDFLLEIGCSYGYNLMFMNQKYGMECHGIDPSPKAIDYGEELIRKNKLKRIKLQQGFADLLPYKDSYFDAVYIGFCLYQVGRELLFKVLSESDRVLKQGGLCIITDFDTPVPYIRENIHSKMIPTYKTDYAGHLMPYGYSLIEKRTYSHSSVTFVKEIQERVSTQIFYKENITDYYIMG